MFNYISFEITSYSAADALPDLEGADTGMCLYACKPCGNMQ